MRRPTTARTLTVLAVALVVVLLVVLGVIAVMLKVVEYGFGPILAYLSGVPGALPALAFAVLAIGIAFARRFRPRDQGLFLMGLFCVALGFVCLWQLPRLMTALPTPEARVELEGPFLIVGLIISAFLIVCGFQLMGSCKWVRRQEASDNDE